MANILLITPAYVKATTRIDKNVDAKLLTIDIYDNQQIHIEPVLGTDLYNKILADIEASGTPTGDYLTLLCEYIQPCLTKYVEMFANHTLKTKYTNKSVSNSNSETANPVSRADSQSAWDLIKDIAEYKKQRLINYLCENHELFPELKTNDTIDKIRPVQNAYTTAMYLGRSNQCRFDEE